jgi:spore germination protein YaaH
MKQIFTIICISLFALPAVALAKSQENIFYYFPNNTGIESLRENYRDIDIFAPQVYSVGFDLKLADATKIDVLDFAESKNMDVMPLVFQEDFDRALMSKLLADENAREELIDELAREARKRDFIGWQFDFENISSRDRDAYSDFVKEASREFDRKNLEFSVAIVPRTSEYDENAAYQDWSSAYDIEKLSRYTDFISLMSYNDPRSVGPVASLSYVQQVLDFSLSKVRSNKLSLGIPLYCWQYKLGESKKIANVPYWKAAEVLEIYKDGGAFSIYVESLGSELFIFNKHKEGLNLLWCDSVQSVQVKRDLAKDKNLRGVSFWAIGHENEDFWDDF